MSEAALDYVTQAQRRVWTIPDVPADTPIRPVRRVGVVGAGTMGGGIAMNFANVGLPVTLVEQTQDALDRGFGVMRANYERSARRGRFSPEEAEARMGRLTGSLDLDALAGCDLVIEAVFEDMDLKRSVFRRLDAVAKPEAILGTNTSGLNVDQIAAATRRPESVIGLHFFSPANVMKLVEIVRGAKTARSVIATSMQVAREIGKIAVLVGVCPGFVGNRMLYPRQGQANALVMEGVMPWDVDRVLTDFGFKMGPFAMSDLAGLDIGWTAATSRGETLRDQLCERDRRGQKTGKGYYDYDADRRPRPSAEVEALIRSFAARSGATTRTVSDAEILERCLFPMVNEGAKILAEGIAARASDIDVVWLSGYNWPAATGGPMFWADGFGLPHVVARLEAYQARQGPGFAPSDLLRRLAAAGRRFTDLADGAAVAPAALA